VPDHLVCTFQLNIKQNRSSTTRTHDQRRKMS
jgi:hypothetical protein